MSFKKITHIIYDMDGVLLDTEPFYTQVNQAIAQKYGKQFDWAIKSQTMGKKSIDSARIWVKSLDLPITPEAYLAERTSKLEQLFPSAQPLPGAVRLIQHFKQQGIPQALATSSTQHTFHLKTTHHKDWFSLFDVIFTGEAVKQGKPAPDIFLAAAQALQGSPPNCLVFEDSPAGIEAAIAAKMSVVAVPDPRLDKTFCQGADQILNSLEEFVPEQWGLPAFSSNHT
ncbi:MAG: HAD family hydrolase [Candidatus Parabeggiatoa sp. nov. 1]|nr:MAG: HAD family hydrolase [Gammaproteobacteria bacterium]